MFDPAVDERIILKWLFRKWERGGDMDLIVMAQNSDSCRALVNAVMNHIGKGKTIPLQALTGPEGSRRLRLPDFKTIGT
jgi:hypothetical protein